LRAARAEEEWFLPHLREKPIWAPRVKEAQVGLFATRSSCHHFVNQSRLLLPALAYVLIERMRTLALQGTESAMAQVDAQRIRLPSLAGVVARNTRRIRLLHRLELAPARRPSRKPCARWAARRAHTAWPARRQKNGPQPKPGKGHSRSAAGAPFPARA
jgi:hypothetical protein